MPPDTPSQLLFSNQLPTSNFIETPGNGGKTMSVEAVWPSG